ncbi:MAG: RNA polymerase sigma factor [Raineya sp.]|jgi:RNA polymerase sigma-70 factor (ECF subfamily)|nr:RNA polymerase sigma factor [Raineya sp.]
MTSQEESAYITAVLEGNTQAYAYLINKHKSLVYSLCLKITKNKEDAEEVAQDVFLKAYQQLNTFKRDSKFATWLYRIAYNTSLNKIKRKKVWQESINQDDEDHPALQIEDTTFENQFDLLNLAEKRKYIQIAMQALSEQDAVIITLFYFAEHNLEEIAEVTGIDKNNVKIKLHRARKKLYNELSCLLPQKELETLIG